MFVRSPGAKTFMGQDFKLYASKETRATIPPEDMALLDRLLPQWSGGNVILVSAKDTNSRIRNPESAGPDKLYTRQFQNFLGQLPIERTNPAGDNQNLKDVYGKAAHGEFAAVDSKSFKQTGMMSVAVNYDDINRVIPAGLAGLPQGMLKNVPGTSTDWMLAVVAHEAGHLSSAAGDAANFSVVKTRYAEMDAINVSNNDREIVADRKGLTNYFALRAQKPDLNPDVPAAYMAFRAIGTLHQSGDALSGWKLDPTDHGTNPAIRISGTSVTPAPGVSSGRIDAAVVDMNSRIHMLIGLEERKNLTPAAKASLDRATEGIMTKINNPDVTKLAKQNGLSPDALYDLAIGDGRAALLRQAGTNASARETMQAMMVGNILSKTQPLTEYAAVKFLYDKGEFKTETQRKIAEDYIKAFEKYVPEAAGQPVKDYLAKLEKDWPEIQRQQRNMPFMQQAIESAKNQFHEPHAIREAGAPPTTGMA
jgi:hypothetical protein